MKGKTPQSGQVALSLQGRDKGELYVIAEVSGGKALVVDGRKRKLENPKTKNIKHLRLLPVNISQEGIVRDKSFNARVAHFLKMTAGKVKSEE